jgi:hypothetical protein
MARYRKRRHGKRGGGFKLPLIGKLTAWKVGLGFAAYWFFIRPAMAADAAAALASETIQPTLVTAAPVDSAYTSPPSTIAPTIYVE